MSQRPDNQMQSSVRFSGVDGVSEGKPPPPPRPSELREQRRSFSTITAAAVVVAVGNLLTLVSLPWTQASLFGDTNPAVWLALGLIIPIALISASIYRSYWKLRNESSATIERLGPYILKEKLGQGGMGEVYLAEHALMKRHCAVKLIHPDRARDRDMCASFLREAKATAQLTHWNTVEVYDYGMSDDGRFYYVMEYLQGVNLWQYVDQFGPMNAGRVVYILKQLCDALYEAECAGLVHRDIKPSNIFLTERGKSCDVAKLLDFGLVQTVTKDPIKLRNVSTTLHGSPAFMCPEQAVGMVPDCRGDLYSLGAVAYFLLTGRPPFIDENPIMLIVAHATTSVPTFADVGADVPQELGEVILKCLARDPSARFHSARELLGALETCEYGNQWTWRDAERWWQQHTPQSIPETEITTLEVTDTQPFNRDEVSHDPEKTIFGYDMPTQILDLPSELQNV